MRYNFTDATRSSLARARAEALRLGHDYVGTEHLVLALLGDRDVLSLVDRCNAKEDLIRSEVMRRIKEGRPKSNPKGELPYTSRAKKIIELALAEARRRRSEAVGTEHFLMGALLEEKGIGAQALRESGLTPDLVRAALPASTEVVEEARGRGILRRTRTYRLRIDDASDRSIYEQIIAQITEAVATGELRPGERLATVRQLADQLDVAPGTVARAYSELERLGVVVTEGARGTRVADRGAPPARMSEGADTLAGLLRPVAVAAFHLGATADDLRQALETAMRGIFDKRDEAA
jgi:DNA-binding transcriptional regulator YhcF (GntR family)